MIPDPDFVEIPPPAFWLHLLTVGNTMPGTHPYHILHEASEGAGTGIVTTPDGDQKASTQMVITLGNVGG